MPQTKDNNGSPNAFRQLKVLVVDDNLPAAQTLGWMIEHIGHEVHLLFDGMELPVRALSLIPDVILLDIAMPGKSGYDLCRELRAMPELKNTHFIAQTGWAREADKQLAFDAGFDLHLVKPFQLDTLEKMLKVLY